MRSKIVTSMIVMTMALVGAACGSTTATPTPTPGDQALRSLLPASIKGSGILVVGTDAEYPPCEYYPSGSGTMVGFEPDIWNAMAQVLGLKVQAISIAFDSLIPGVLDGRFPVAVECISDTTSREAEVSLVDFMYDQAGVLSLASETGISTNPTSLCGLTAAEEEGNIEATRVTSILTPYCQQNGKPAVNETTYPAEAQVVTAIESGRADFTLDDLAAEAYLAESSSVKLKVESDELLPRDYIGMVTTTSARGLQQALVGALKVIEQNGEYAKILKKWGVSDLALTTPGVDLEFLEPNPDPVRVRGVASSHPRRIRPLAAAWGYARARGQPTTEFRSPTWRQT